MEGEGKKRVKLRSTRKENETKKRKRSLHRKLVFGRRILSRRFCCFCFLSFFRTIHLHLQDIFSADGKRRAGGGGGQHNQAAAADNTATATAHQTRPDQSNSRRHGPQQSTGEEEKHKTTKHRTTQRERENHEGEKRMNDKEMN